MSTVLLKLKHSTALADDQTLALQPKPERPIAH